MKLSLRNLALAALVTVAGSVVAQDAITVTKVWEHNSLYTSGNQNDQRFGTGIGGKVYFAKKDAGKVMVVDGTGNPTEYATVEGLGSAITSDDAGNILVNTDFPNAGSCTEMVIVPADGSEQIKLSLQLPENVVADMTARMDQIGRITGDIMSDEGGIMYITPGNTGTSSVAILIRNGQQDLDAFDYADQTVAPATVNTSTCANPRYSFEEIMENPDEAYTMFTIKNRSQNNMYVCEGGEMVPVPVKDFAGNGTEGHDMFSLGGKEYQVLPAKLSTNHAPEYQIHDFDGNLIAVIDLGDSNGSQGFGSIVARKVSDTKVELYFYYATNGTNNGLFAAMYEVTVAGDEPVELPSLYYTGDFTNPTWSATNAIELKANAEGQYIIELNAVKEYQFKVSTVKADWDAGFNENALGYNKQITTGSYTLEKGNTNNIITTVGSGRAVITEADGVYTLTLEGEWAPISTDLPKDVNLRGDLNGWGSTAMTLESQDANADGYYTYSVTLAKLAKGGLKVADSNWGSFNYGAGADPNLAIDKSNEAYLNSQTNFNVPADMENVKVLFFYNPDADTQYIKLENAGQVEPDPVVIPETLYMLGHVNGNGFASDKAVAAANEDGIFTYNVTVDAADNGYGYFSFATTIGADWDKDVNSTDRFGASEYNKEIALNGQDEIVVYRANVNAAGANSWKILAGDYKIMADLNDMIVTVTEQETPQPEIEYNHTGVWTAQVDMNVGQMDELDLTDPIDIDIKVAYNGGNTMTISPMFNVNNDYHFDFIIDTENGTVTTDELFEYNKYNDDWAMSFDYFFSDYEKKDKKLYGKIENIDADHSRITLETWGEMADYSALGFGMWFEVILHNNVIDLDFAIEGLEVPVVPAPTTERYHYAYDLNSSDMGEGMYTISFNSTGDAPKAVLVLTRTNEAGEELVTEHELGSVVKGENSFSFDASELYDVKYTWAVRLHNYAVEEDVINVVDNGVAGGRTAITSFIDPEYPEVYGYTVFGRTKNGGFDIYDRDGVKVNDQPLHTNCDAIGGAAANGSSPMDAATRGNEVYFASWGDSSHGVVAFDLAKALQEEDSTPYSVFEGTKAGNGKITTDDGVATGSGTPTVAVWGKGEDTTILTFDEDIFTNQWAVNVIGNGKTTANPAEQLGQDWITGNKHGRATSHSKGFFLMQRRANGSESGYLAALAFVKMPEREYVWESSEIAEEGIIPSADRGIAINNDETLLALTTYQGVRIFNLDWTAEGKPALSLNKAIEIPGVTDPDANSSSAITGLAFDGGNNLHVACYKHGYYTVTPANEEAKATTKAPADMVMMGTTALGNIAVDGMNDGEAVYYNLNGVRVNGKNLPAGIYVKVVGKTATKVVIK